MRLFFALALSALLLPAGALVSAKGHVPSHKDQVCHNGKTITVSESATPAHLAHGDTQLPEDDPQNVFFTGDDCSSFVG